MTGGEKCGLAPLLDLARELGPHIMLIHHLGKSERDGGDGILGSTALQGAVDTMMILNRTDKHRTIKTIQRYGQDLEETVLTFDPDTKQSSLGESKQSGDLSEASDRICSYLRKNAGAIKGSDIVNEIGGKRQKLLNALRSLEAEGRILRHGIGGRGSPHTYELNPNYSAQSPQF